MRDLFFFMLALVLGLSLTAVLLEQVAPSTLPEHTIMYLRDRGLFK